MSDDLLARVEEYERDQRDNLPPGCRGLLRECAERIRFDADHIAKLNKIIMPENERLRKALEGLRRITDRQADDDALWFIGGQVTAPEAYIQQALRELHEAIESSDA
jgi:hypothetical protein